MKLSNQNICNLQGFKNFWGQCQMPLGGGGGGVISGGLVKLGNIGNENHIGVPVINLCHNKKTI